MSFKTLQFIDAHDSTLLAEAKISTIADSSILATFEYNQPNFTVSDIEVNGSSALLQAAGFTLQPIQYEWAPFIQDLIDREVTFSVYISDSSNAPVLIHNGNIGGRYADKVVTVGGTFSAPHKAATETMVTSLVNASRNFLSEVYDIHLFKGETWESGMLALKDHYNLSSLNTTYENDARFVAGGFDAIGTDGLATGLDVSAMAVPTILQGMGVNLASFSINGTFLGALTSSHANISDVGGIFGSKSINGNAGDLTALTTGWNSIFDRTQTHVQGYDDGVAGALTVYAGAQTKPDELFYGGYTLGFGTAVITAGYIPKVNWTTAEIAEFEGILDTWLTAVGR